MDIIGKIEKLEQDVEQAWEHNRFLQRVLDHARHLGHDVEGWVAHVVHEIEEGVEAITGIDVDGDGDGGYC